jgi:hypothetical protein
MLTRAVPGDLRKPLVDLVPLGLEILEDHFLPAKTRKQENPGDEEDFAHVGKSRTDCLNNVEVAAISHCERARCL